MAPGARSKFGAPCSNLRSFGSKYTLLKKVLVTLLGLFGALRSHSSPHSDSAPGELCPPFPPRYAPAYNSPIIKNENVLACFIRILNYYKF